MPNFATADLSERNKEAYQARETLGPATEDARSVKTTNAGIPFKKEPEDIHLTIADIDSTISSHTVAWSVMDSP